MAGREVAIVCPDMSQNCLGRALTLAEVVSLHAPVRVVGVQRGARIWPPASGSRIPLEARPLRGPLRYRRAAQWLTSRLADRHVLISKPRFTSLGLVEAAGIHPSRCILDIDDWELGMLGFRDSPLREELPPDFVPVGGGQSWTGPNATRRLRAMEGRVPRYALRTVSNLWLRARFGGERLPHLRDLSVFDPARFDARREKARLGLSARPWVGFIGTPRSHKGVGDLLDAIVALSSHRSAPGLLLCGTSMDRADDRALVARANEQLGPERFCQVPEFAFEQLPRHLAAADLLCVPSRRSLGSTGQIPAKLFDGLAMGKPVVASRVGEIEEWVEGCGRCFEPGDVRELAAAIGDLLRRPETLAGLGVCARARAEQRLGLEAGSAVLLPMLARLEDVASVARRSSG